MRSDRRTYLTTIGSTVVGRPALNRTSPFHTEDVTITAPTQVSDEHYVVDTETHLTTDEPLTIAAGPRSRPLACECYYTEDSAAPPALGYYTVNGTRHHQTSVVVDDDTAALEAWQDQSATVRIQVVTPSKTIHERVVTPSYTGNW
jgi:hypothetical protein